MNIKITVGKIVLPAVFYDSNDELGLTGRALESRLPIESTVHKRGPEIYFSIDPIVPYERTHFQSFVVDAGYVAYWPKGSCLSFFLGLARLDYPDDVFPARSLDIFGHLIGDDAFFAHTNDQIKEGDVIRIEKA